MCSTFSFHVTSRRPEAAIDWARSAIARCPASFGNSRALISLFARGRRQVFVAAAAGPIRASAVSILLGLGRDRGRRRILYLPTISAPGAVRGSQPLRHDALATGRAGVLVHDLAVNGVLLVEDNTIQRPPQQLIGQLRCSLFSTAEILRSVPSFWSERRDLNSGPPVPQTGALTGLRYAPSQTATIMATV